MQDYKRHQVYTIPSHHHPPPAPPLSELVRSSHRDFSLVWEGRASRGRKEKVLFGGCGLQGDSQKCPSAESAAEGPESVSPSPSALAPTTQQGVCWPFATSPRQICTLELKVIFIRTYINMCCVGGHLCPCVLAKGGGERLGM